jgi:hypothetical protein
MNRILQADVILTLTREQAARLLASVDFAVRRTHQAEYVDLLVFLREQCAKQGVQL